MAITGVNKLVTKTAATANGANVMGSMTTTTGRVYLAMIQRDGNGGSILPANGLGITWTSYGAVGVNTQLFNAFYGTCTTGSTGNFVVNTDFSNSSSGIFCFVEEFDGADGSGFIVQQASDDDAANNTYVATLAAFASPDNVAYQVFCSFSGAGTPEAGNTVLGSFYVAGDDAYFKSAYKVNDPSASASAPSALAGLIWALELKASSVPTTTVGPKDGTTAASSGGTVSWVTPSNGLTSDNTYTTHTTSTTAANMPYLNITGYDFSSIPDDATIVGITVSVERKYTGGTTGNVRDNTLQLMKAGTRVGTNKAATAANWGTTDTTISYGGPTDLWGTTWTPSEIKNANFGASFRAIGNGTSANRVANVDEISISVTYKGGTVVATDPYWANVVAALHFNGTNGSTSMLDQTGRSWSAYNGAALSTTAPIMGSASLALDGTDDYIKSTTNLDDLRFGTGDFTIEVDFKPNGSTAGQILVDYLSPTMTAGWQIYLSGFGSGIGFYTDADFNYIEAGTHSWADGDWHQAVVTRTGGKLRIFLDGQLYATVNNTVNYNQTAPALLIGRQGLDLGYGFNGLIDEVRITNGVARYTAAFTTPTTEFPHGAPSYVTPPVELAYSQTVGFTQAASLTVTKALAYSQTVGITQAASLTTPKSLAYSQSIGLTQAAIATTPKSLSYAQSISFDQAASLTTPKYLGYTQNVGLTQSAGLTVGSQPVAYNQVISFTQAAVLTVSKIVGYTQAVGLTQAATLTTSKALSYTQSIGLTQTAALTTPKSLGYAQTVSFTQSAELTITRPSVPAGGGGYFAGRDQTEDHQKIAADKKRRRDILDDLIDPKPVVVVEEVQAEPEPEAVVVIAPKPVPFINTDELELVAEMIAVARANARKEQLQNVLQGVLDGFKELRR